jgi:hypothetical protein
MPNYTFEDRETGEEQTLSMTMAEHEEFVKNNPHLQQVFRNMTVLDSWNVAGAAKPPADFSKYVLGKVRDKMPGADKAQFERRWNIPKEI